MNRFGHILAVLLILAGLGCICWGVWLWMPALGLVASGICAAGIGVVMIAGEENSVNPGPRTRNAGSETGERRDDDGEGSD